MKHLLLAFFALFFASAAVAQENYLVRPGDSLRIEVLEDSSLNRTVIVLPDGRFSFPFAGTVLAGGRTLGQVERSLTESIASNFAIEPNVFVSIATLRQRQAATGGGRAAPATISVFFLGEVSSPGGKNLAPGTTILQALAQSGGFTNFAALKRIQIRRTNPTTGEQSLITLNYQALADGAELRGNVVLQEGDVILVPERRLFE